MPFTEQEIKEFLEKALRETHEAEGIDHAFTPHALDAGICGICGWFDPNGPKARCGHTMHEHGTLILEALKAGKLKIGQPVVVTYIGLGSILGGYGPFTNPWARLWDDVL